MISISSFSLQKWIDEYEKFVNFFFANISLKIDLQYFLKFFLRTSIFFGGSVEGCGLQFLKRYNNLSLPSTKNLNKGNRYVQKSWIIFLVICFLVKCMFLFFIFFSFSQLTLKKHWFILYWYKRQSFFFLKLVQRLSPKFSTEIQFMSIQHSLTQFFKILFENCMEIAFMVWSEYMIWDQSSNSTNIVQA